MKTSSATKAKIKQGIPTMNLKQTVTTCYALVICLLLGSAVSVVRGEEAAENPITASVEFSVENGYHDNNTAYACATGNAEDVLIIKASMKPSWLPASSLTWTITDIDGEVVSADEVHITKDQWKGIGTLTAEIDYVGPNGGTAKAKDTIKAAIVDVDSINLSKDKICVGQSSTFTATMKPAGLTLGKLPIWQQDKAEDIDKFGDNWQNMGLRGTTVQAKLGEHGQYRITAICDTKDEDDNSRDLMERLDVYPRLEAVILRRFDTVPRQEPFTNVDKRKVGAKVTFKDEVEEFNWWFDVKLDFIDAHDEDNIQDSKLAGNDDLHFLTTGQPGELFVRASYPDIEDCPEADSLRVIRYTATVEPAALRFDWPTADDVIDGLFTPIVEEQNGWIDYAKDAKNMIDNADNVVTAAEAELLLNMRENEKNLKRAEEMVGEFKIGREGKVPRHAEWWQRYRTDRQGWIRDLELEIETIKNSDKPQHVKDNQIANRTNKINKFSKEMDEATQFISRLGELETENINHINRMKKSIQFVKEYSGVKAPIGTAVEKMAQSINDSKLPQEWIAKAARYGGKTLSVVGVAIDVHTIYSAQNSINEVKAKMDQFKDVPDEIKEKIEGLIVDRPVGPLSAGKYIVKTIPGGVEFSLQERDIVWKTQSKIYDVDGNNVHDEGLSSNWKHLTTVETVDDTCYSNAYITSDGADGTWEADVYAHGNMGSSVVHALGYYTKEGLGDRTFSLFTARGSTRNEMLAAAEVAKSEADRNSEIWQLRVEQVSAAVGLLAAGLLILLVAMTTLTAGLAALIGVAIAGISALVSWLFSFWTTSELVTSIKYLYPK